MTNEEIEQNAWALLEETRRLQANPLGDSDAYHAAYSTFLRVLVSQAYEKAIKATCPYCVEGLPLVPDNCDDPAHSVEQVQGESRYVFVPCPARDVHALKQSLVSEPVAST